MLRQHLREWGLKLRDGGRIRPRAGHSNYVENPPGAERKHRGWMNCHFKVMFHVWRDRWLDGSCVQDDGYGMGCVLCGRVQG